MKDKIRDANPWFSHFLLSFRQANNQALQARHVLVLLFGTLQSFSCFSHEFMVHINENVSFHHVVFLHLIRYVNLHRKCLNKANVCFVYFKKDRIFFFSVLSFIFKFW